MSLDKNIRRLIMKAQAATKQSLAYIREDIDDLVSNNIQSESRIEGVLDRILDCLYLGLGEEEFRRLNDYYAKFNKEKADYYE